jgi:hypothetical protein
MEKDQTSQYIGNSSSDFANLPADLTTTIAKRPCFFSPSDFSSEKLMKVDAAGCEGADGHDVHFPQRSRLIGRAGHD